MDRVWSLFFCLFSRLFPSCLYFRNSHRPSIRFSCTSSRPWYHVFNVFLYLCPGTAFRGPSLRLFRATTGARTLVAYCFPWVCSLQHSSERFMGRNRPWFDRIWSWGGRCTCDEGLFPVVWEAGVLNHNRILSCCREHRGSHGDFTPRVHGNDMGMACNFFDHGRGHSCNRSRNALSSP